MNKASIYLTDQTEISPNSYKSVTQLDNDFTLTVTSRVKLTPMDGKVFDYALSKRPFKRDGVNYLNIIPSTPNNKYGTLFALKEDG
jgi:hypothetical protein